MLAGFLLLVFRTGTAEYLVAGVLPQLAEDVSVSIATAGQTVTAYALGVAIGGPIVTALTARLPRGAWRRLPQRRRGGRRRRRRSR